MAASWPYWFCVLTLMFTAVCSEISDGNHIEDRDIKKETSKSSNSI